MKKNVMTMKWPSLRAKNKNKYAFIKKKKSLVGSTPGSNSNLRNCY